jgi:hypothetical protein
MDDKPVTTDDLRQLAAKKKGTKQADEQAGTDLAEGAMTAWSQGMRPATISEATGLNPSWLRKLARDRNLPAAPAGPRTRKERDG